MTAHSNHATAPLGHVDAMIHLVTLGLSGNDAAALLSHAEQSSTGMASTWPDGANFPVWATSLTLTMPGRFIIELG